MCDSVSVSGVSVRARCRVTKYQALAVRSEVLSVRC